MGPFFHGPLFHGPFLHTIWPALIVVAWVVLAAAAWRFAPWQSLSGGGSAPGPRLAGVPDGFGAAARSSRGWRAFATGSGNSAFDERRTAELARLEDEGRRLEAAHQELAGFLEQLRRTEDREEFDRVVNTRLRRRPPESEWSRAR